MTRDSCAQAQRNTYTSSCPDHHSNTSYSERARGLPYCVWKYGRNSGTNTAYEVLNWIFRIYSTSVIGIKQSIRVCIPQRLTRGAGALLDKPYGVTTSLSSTSQGPPLRPRDASGSRHNIISGSIIGRAAAHQPLWVYRMYTLTLLCRGLQQHINPCGYRVYTPVGTSTILYTGVYIKLESTVTSAAII